MDATLPAQETLELLQQAAVRAGLLDASEPPPRGGVASEATAVAIEALLERELSVPEPDEAACRRHFAAHAARFAAGGSAAERARLRHVLFAVTPGVDVTALRQRAEACLVDLRAAGSEVDARFAAAAREFSNCPSGAEGGALGWLTAADCAPEFAREVFGRPGVGVLPRLVASRFGLHVVEVLERRPAQALPYEAVAAAVRSELRRQAWATQAQAYVRQLLDARHADALPASAH